jgi:hypothetical protein
VSTTTDLGAIRRVQLRGLPVQVWARAQEHHEELSREFALIMHGNDHDALPARLLRVVAELRARFAAFTTRTTEQLHAAAQRGEDRIDISFDVPEAAADATHELEALLDEADDYCRQGDLLTLATPDELVAFRRWYLEEFRRQIGGEEPVSWDDWRAGVG